MSTSPGNDNSLKNLLRELKTDPLKAADLCHAEYKASRLSHNDALYETIAFIVAFVLALEDSAESRKEFLTLPYWRGKPHPPKEENLVRLATMYVMGAKESHGPLYQSALSYTKFVERFVEMDINPEDIPGELRKTPLYLTPVKKKDGRPNTEKEEEVGSTRAAPKRAAGGGGTLAEEDSDGEFGVADDEPDDEPDDDDDPSDAPPKRPRAAGGGGGSSDDASGKGGSKPITKGGFHKGRDVAIDGSVYLHAILALEPGQRRWIRIERTDQNEGGWKTFRVLTTKESMGPVKGP